MFRVTCALVLILGMIGCGDDYFCPCTAQIVSIKFTVVDNAGLPVPDVSTQVALARTGEDLTIAQPYASVGEYIAFDDAHIRHISSFFAESVRVTGTKDIRGFSAEFVIDRDECNCHVHKVSGPESVRLE